MTIELENGPPPEWMIALENKKRNHTLAHEIGAGAPCLKCNDGCLGLDLHFWRKICRNCKCKKELHDVKDERNVEQFEILFGVNFGGSERVKKISLNLKCKLDDIFASRDAAAKENSKTENDLSFDWIPADVPTNLASEYLQQLPLDKLPITGSAGAMLRRQQLQKQIPLHDFKVNNCHDLTDEETLAFTEYVDNLKNNAVGQGLITKIMPLTATNDTIAPKLPLFSQNLNSTPKPFKGFSCDSNTSEFPSPSPSTELHFPTADLKTPSAFVPYRKLNAKLTPSRHPDESLDTSLPSLDTSLPHYGTSLPHHDPSLPHHGTSLPHHGTSLLHHDTSPPHHGTSLPHHGTSLPHSSQPISYPKQHPTSSPVDRLAAQYADKLTVADRNLRDLDTVNNNTNDNKHGAGPITNNNGYSISGNINNNNGDSIGNINDNHTKGVPVTSPVENLTPSQIIRKFNAAQKSLPSPAREASVKREIIRTPNTFCERSRPFAANASFSSPLQDAHADAAVGAASQNVDARYLKLGNPEQFVALSSYVPNRPQLSNTLSTGTASPMLPLARDTSPLTIAAGTVPTVGTLLHDRNQNPRVHFGEATLMGSEEELLADPGQQLAPAFGSSVIHPDTYGTGYNVDDISCHQCKQMVQPGQVVVVAERAGSESIWHPSCFVCVICQELLVDLVYFFHRGEVHCGRHYAEVLKIPRCFACDELIFLKEYTVAEGQTFHFKHFCCFECDIPLAEKSYVSKDDNPVCLPCYELKYSKRCNCCGDTIKAGDSRVGWKELSWHATASCFKCVQCLKSLLGGKFVVRSDKPLCSKECIIQYDLTVRSR